MIDVACTCGVHENVPESQAGIRWLCPSCGRTAHLVAGESLPEGAGAGDFDASLTILSGPTHVGERYLLGGVADISLGKLPDQQIVLPGEHVSQHHCVMRRVDYGPSRWQVVDAGSADGIFVNSERVAEHELTPGDDVTIGEFDLRYDAPAARPEPQVAQLSSAGPAFAPEPPAHPTTSGHGSGMRQPFYVPMSHHSAPPAAGRSLWSRIAFWKLR